jgi:hypothetical protein
MEIVQANKKVIRPIVAEAAIPPATIDQEVMQPGRAHSAIFASERCGVLYCSFGQASRLAWIHPTT